MEIIVEREYYPSGDKLLLTQRDDGYYCVEQQVGDETNLLLCCTGEYALSASYDYYVKRYNLIKHILYPKFGPEHEFEEYKAIISEFIGGEK